MFGFKTARQLAFVLAAMTVLGGCDRLVEGDLGTVSFAAHVCGAYSLGCTLEKAIVVGGTVEVSLDGDGAAGRELVSQDPGILSLDPMGAAGGVYLATGRAAGQTLLRAVDPDTGEVTDEVSVEVVQASDLGILALNSGMERDLAADSDGKQVWRVVAGKVMGFFVLPEVAESSTFMGNFPLEVVSMSEEIASSMASLEGIDAEQGLLGFEVPAGTYDLTMQTGDGFLELNARFIAE